jgi:CheY-like chemotaxis protein
MNSPTIVLAEDNEDDVFMFHRACKKNGVVKGVTVFEDGQGVIDYLGDKEPFGNRAKYPLPKLIILDLKMPRVDGFQVLEWLRGHHDMVVIPTIVWSASADIRDVKHAYCLGANAYICKPGGFEETQEMFCHLVTFWKDCLIAEPAMAQLSCEELKKNHPFSNGSNK